VAKVSFFIIKTEKMKNIEYILNDCLNKAMCQKNRIQNPNSNNIADFVYEYLQTEKLTLTDVGCSLPTKKIINYLEKQEDFYIEEVEIANKFYNTALNDVLYFIVKEEEKLK